MEEYLAMPVMWLKAHLETLAELQGEECFREAEVISIGSGKLNKKEHGKVIRRWNAAIGNERGGNSRNPTSAQLEAMGLKVHHGG